MLLHKLTTSLILMCTTILPASASDAPVIRSHEDRLNAVINDLTLLTTDYLFLHEAIKEFRGQAFAFNTIDTYERMVEAHLRDSISDAAACPSLDDDESRRVMDALAKPHPDFLQELLDSITARKPQFDHINKADEVLKWLQNLYGLSNQLPLALEEKVGAADAEEIEGERLWRNELFEYHIAMYSM
ncbi:hydrophobic surface binding protein A-domain-containing protein [Aspergillus ambiguus]|uniref:cell wall mannoprotein 1 family protein n=1 Tax=Aspergillus ambiguus TaxID=176160 RepID=UPI003CCCB957